MLDLAHCIRAVCSFVRSLIGGPKGDHACLNTRVQPLPCPQRARWAVHRSHEAARLQFVELVLVPKLPRSTGFRAHACVMGGGRYGDGRAISVGEVVVAGQRWELQLKGGGTTPFCRGADGRAVLRSSVREFLASEAMDALGVSTTRALCLIVSGSETAQRPWYSDERDDELPTEDDPRLAHYPPHVRKALLAQLASQTRDPDVMVTEKVAITTRVATSFTRIGHIDLFARRAARPGATELARTQHAAIVEHLLFREYVVALSSSWCLAIDPIFD